MRIQIREQLAILILTSALIGLAVISLAVWFTNYSFVLNVRASRLAYVAALKAAQLASDLDIMQTAINFISTRVLVQEALQRYNNGNTSSSNWLLAIPDLEAAIGSSRSLGQSILHQAVLFPRLADGESLENSLLNATDSSVIIDLPYTYPNGSNVLLGDPGLGYPPNLYPNLTYSDGSAYFEDVELNATTSNLVLGPWWINSSFALLSLTTAVVNNTLQSEVLGYLTVVMDGGLIADIVDSRQGLDNTGETLVVAPYAVTNRLPANYSADNSDNSQMLVQYIALQANDTDRHPDHIVGLYNPPFPAGDYPAIVQAFEANASSPEASGSDISTYNENGDQVSTGYSTVDNTMVNWIILVEQAQSEVWQPIVDLRDILLACVFGTVAFLLIISFPLAHFAVLPIRRLREATRKSVAPSSASRSSFGSFSTVAHDLDGADINDADIDEAVVIARKEGFRERFTHWQARRRGNGGAGESRHDRRRKREFRIPGKVKERKQWVKDELSDLTTTFNEMSDELMMQYSKLEERVQQRTAELELSKKAAEVANESKTLFIANISHELKTPLNGILGMCAVCMHEEDPVKLKRELGVIYKSGDLLLNLLNDLLQFTRNQVGQQLTLEEREFRLRDVSSQVLAIFEKQAKESHIELRVEFHTTDGTVSDGNISDANQDAAEAIVPGYGRLKDYILWGDVHRILQVVINLVSNSLKFTPSGGSVTLRIRCLAEKPANLMSALASIDARQSRRKPPKRHGSASTTSGLRRDWSSKGSLRERPPSFTLGSAERTSSPPVAYRFLYFEFQVQDTGPGIPPDQQQRIFEPFVQGDLGLSRKYGGTGLGLSICSQLATLMNGKISVESTVDVGSTFTMVMPLRHLETRKDSTASSAIIATDTVMDLEHNISTEDFGAVKKPRLEVKEVDSQSSLTEPGAIVVAAAAAAAVVAAAAAVPPPPAPDSQPRLIGLRQPFFAATESMESPSSQAAAIERVTAEAARGGRIRVLVAEDNKVNQEVVTRMLKLEDIYDVTVASDGQVAVDMVKKNMAEGLPPFNLIFMDIQMPLMDGIQSTKMIREAGYSAPIVALTAFAEESNIKDCLDSGMNYFLSKPIRRPQLKKVLKEYCAPIPEESEDVTPPTSETKSGTKIKIKDDKTSATVNADSVS